jgi:hypothetical protein
MKGPKENNDSVQKDIQDPSDSKPKSLFQMFEEMPYTDKTGKGFVQSINKLPETTETNKLEDEKIEDDDRKVTERKSFLHLRSLNIRPE